MNTIKNKIKGSLMWVLPFSTILSFGAIAWTVTSCTDEWDDHYAADAQSLTSATQTIWQNISSRSDLSQFRALVEKAGLANKLNEVNSYTVWAPKDGTFNYDSLSQVGDSLLKARFLNNHIALYAHSISGSESSRVTMLNLKKKYFEGAPGSYTIADIPIVDANIASSNGFLHVINEAIPYRASIFESLNNDYFPIDSISDYIHQFDVHEIDELKSTEGPTLHGERTYLDTVYIDYNRFANRINRWINEEDSSYTMIVPTNVAWTKARNKIKSYLNIIPSYKYLDGTNDSERAKNTKDSAPIDAEYLKDSLTSMLLTQNLIINNNLYDNEKLKNLQPGQQLNVDSLMFGGETLYSVGGLNYTSAYTKLYRNEARDLFTGITRQDASNGALMITDTLRWHPWNSWCTPIKIEGEYADVSGMDNVVSAQNSNIGVGTLNPNVSGNVSGRGFLTVTGRANTNPKIDFYLDGILSTEYNIYVVVLPNNITNVYDTIPRRNQLQFIVGNNDENGNLTTWGWQNNKMVSVNNNRITYFLGDVVESDPTKVDTLYVGTINFPICYHDAFARPFLRIEDCVENRKDLVTSDLRLDCIILVPTEFDAYLREHPEYYDDRTGVNKFHWPLKPED